MLILLFFASFTAFHASSIPASLSAAGTLITACSTLPAMLDGLLDRVDEELGEPVNAILTGGVAPLIAPYCKRTMHVEPDLLIRGLQIIYEKNKG